MGNEDQIRRTIARYCHYFDDRRVDDFADLFTSDGSFVAGGGVHQGRDAIRAFVAQMGEAPIAKHITTNTVIDIDGDRARSWSDYLVLSNELAILSAGRYHDILVRDGDGWLFEKREIVNVGQSPRGA